MDAFGWIMSFVFLFLGTLIGYFVSLYMPWIARKLFRVKSKSKIVYYNIDSGEVKESRDPNSNSLRIVIITDLLTANITFNFTHFYYKKNGEHRLHKQYHYPYFSRWGEKSDDYITHLKNEKYHEFLEKDIFFLPSAYLTSPLQSVLTIFDIPEAGMTK